MPENGTVTQFDSARKMTTAITSTKNTSRRFRRMVWVIYSAEKSDHKKIHNTNYCAATQLFTAHEKKKSG